MTVTEKCDKNEIGWTKYGIQKSVTYKVNRLISRDLLANLKIPMF